MPSTARWTLYRYSRLLFIYDDFLYIHLSHPVYCILHILYLFLWLLFPYDVGYVLIVSSKQGYISLISDIPICDHDEEGDTLHFAYKGQNNFKLKYINDFSFL